MPPERGPRVGLDIQVHFTLEILPNRVKDMMDTPGGPVGRYVESVADILVGAAAARVGDRYSGHHPGPSLKDSGRVEPAGGSGFNVIFDHPVAFLHHEGKSSGYPITPHNSKGILANQNNPARSGGGTFFAKGAVTWTGQTQGNPFLLDAAEELGLRASGALLRGSRLTPLFRTRKIVF